MTHPGPMTGPGWVEALIDLDALGANIRFLRESVAPAELMVVVKADAYGHGRLPVAREAAALGIRWIGALDLETALDLRGNGIGDDVAVLAWLYPPGAGFADAIRARIDLGVSSREELDGILADASSIARDPGFRAPRLHLELDTGLHRNGATERDWPELVSAAVRAERAGLVRIHAAWTHIAEASEDEDTLALERFLAGVETGRALGAAFPLRHLAASSAGLRRADVRLDLVRMGGHCWGIPSFGGVTPGEIGLRPVMTLRSRVTRVEGDRVLVSAGYGDGVPRRIAGRVGVAVRGRLLPVVAVHRDELELDRTGMPVRAGDAAVLFGSGDDGEQTVRQWGDLTGTLGDEITTRIATRVPRRWIGGTARPA